ncbi:MAG: hypothetical protein DCC67_10690 [Planctomycetota bacterium]|nr:MAG: hypothetical protein DCC67_10690 [Planctomycetota bacterium]
MGISRTTRWAIALILAVVIVAVGGGLLLRGEYATTQTARRTFVIDEDFTSVRKILVRTDSAKQIVAMGGGSEFISQQWSAIGGAIDSIKLLDPQWRLQLHGTLRVRTKDPYIGQHPIALEQDVVIEVDFLNSDVTLKQPAERLKQYHMKTRFERDPSAGNTRVALELTQEILTDAPWFAHGIADRRVRSSAEQTLANQERAIRRLVAEHIDDVPVFPLR